MAGFNRFSDLNGFDSYAQLINENGAISLVHNGHKFIRDRVENGRNYWRCRKSFRFNCKSRMVTKLMENGKTLLKVRHGEHDHTVEKVTKRKRKQAKSKQRKLSPVNRNVKTGKRLPSKTFATPTKLPKLIPRPMLKTEPNVDIDDTATTDENFENYSPLMMSDPENDIVDID